MHMELRRNATNEPICKAVKETRTSLVAQTVKRLSTMQETRVRSLGREESLEKEMAAHSSTLSWKIPWMEEPGGLQSMESQRVRHDWATLPQQKLRCREKTYGHSGEGEGGVNWKSSVETYTLPYVKW